jgi:beta-lactamase regulating signal transducer with metallopeptidase domain
MNSTSWLSQGEIVALGWTLLHFCWQGTAVALAYSVVDRMTSRAGSGVRYAVALLALALMPVIVVATFVEEMRIAAPHQMNGQTADTNSGFQVGVLQGSTLREIPLTLAPVLEQQNVWLAARAERVLPWLDGVWILGMLLLAVRAMGGWWQLEHARLRARALVSEELERSFRRICEQVHVGRSVALRVSSEVISPLAMGVWRATVILPMSAVIGMPMEELEAVLAHELGHIRRWDYLWNLLQTAVESVLFFHPSVWSLSRTVRERREICCDEIAVQTCAGPTIYALALLRLEEQRTVQLRLAVALDGCNGSLLRRVKQVLGEGMTIESKMTSGVRVAAAGAVVVALLLGPKITEAVAAPMVTAAQPVVAHVVAALPNAMVSQIGGVNTMSFVPVPVAVVPETHIRSLRSTDAPTVAPSPIPQVRVQPLPPHDHTVKEVMASIGEIEFQNASGTASPKGTAYLDGMRDAGYPLNLNDNLDVLMSMKSLGITPEYAKSMNAVGLGKPTVHELISLKSLGVTPEYVAAMKQSGIGPQSFHEVVAEKALGLTPEFAAEMKQKGFGDLSVHQLIALKAQGMTPEYADWLKQQFPQATTEELHRAAIFHLDEKFLASAKAHGFDEKNLDKLLRLKMSGLLDE